MKLKDLWQLVHRGLSEAGIDQPAIESELLLRHALNLDLVELYIQHDRELCPAEENNIRQLMQRRLNGEPSAYITGRREFYGLEYYVNPSVLIPRPETELLVDRALGLAEKYACPIMVDVGTGSGVIAISLARGTTASRIYALDASHEALGVAQTNALRHRVNRRITFLHSDLLSSLPGMADIMIANLPYVRSDEINAGSEPLLALDGGKTGLDVIARFCHQLPGRLNPGGSVLLEVGMGQAEKVAVMLKTALPGVVTAISQDMAGIDRVVYASMPAFAYR